MPEPEEAGTVRIVVDRLFKASPEEVFDAWLDQATAGAWLFATPEGEMEQVEIDPRVGGCLRIEERRGEELASHVGEFLSIERPHRLVFTFTTMPEEGPSRVTVEIQPVDGGSQLTLTHEMDAKWAEFEARTRDGWTIILTGLAEHVEGG